MSRLGIISKIYRVHPSAKISMNSSGNYRNRVWALSVASSGLSSAPVLSKSSYTRRSYSWRKLSPRSHHFSFPPSILRSVEILMNSLEVFRNFLWETLHKSRYTLKFDLANCRTVSWRSNRHNQILKTDPVRLRSSRMMACRLLVPCSKAIRPALPSRYHLILELHIHLDLNHLTAHTAMWKITRLNQNNCFLKNSSLRLPSGGATFISEE